MFERLQRLPKTEISAVNDANSLEKKLYNERKTAREKSLRKAKQWKLNYINSENRCVCTVVSLHFVQPNQTDSGTRTA